VVAAGAQTPAQLESWEAPERSKVAFRSSGCHTDCRSSAERGAADSEELAFAGLRTQLAGAVLEANPRVHMGEECALGRRPTFGIYGTDADSLEGGAGDATQEPAVARAGCRQTLRPPGSRTSRVKPCEAVATRVEPGGAFSQMNDYLLQNRRRRERHAEHGSLAVVDHQMELQRIRGIRVRTWASD